MLPSKEKHYARVDEKNVYRLRPTPVAGSAYRYDITNETEMKLEVDGKKIKNTSKTDVGVVYTMDTDSAGGLLLDTRYDRIHLYTKNGDTETDMDANSPDTATDQVARMLAILKNAEIVTALAPDGGLRMVRGYKEMSDRILASIDPSDVAGRAKIQGQLDHLIGDGMVKKNMAQMFKMFPDSAVHIGDKWKLGSKQSDQFNMDIQTIYTLDDVHDGIAVISADGEVTNGTMVANGASGMGSATADLKGKQHGEYEMDANSGMLLDGKVEISVEGTVQTMGREVPISIHTTVDIKGKKIK